MFARLVDSWAKKKQEKELRNFLSNISAADSDELGLVVACALDWRNRLSEQGFDLLFPANVLIADPLATYDLSKTIGKLQRDGLPQIAVGLMVWVHTLRATNRPELRQLGRDMWRELSRGFPFVDEAADGAASFLGRRFNTEGSGSYPDGLTPIPR